MSQTFELPSREKLHEIRRDLDLTEIQMRTLVVTLKHAEIDLKALNSALPDRDCTYLISKLGRLTRLFANLRQEVARSQKQMHHYLPRKSLEAIGLSVSERMVANLLTEKYNLRGLVAPMPSQRRQYESAKALYQLDPAAFGLEHGSQLLKHLLDAIGTPLDDWIACNNLNKGGRPTDLARTLVILRLAQGAMEIIGRKATATAGGRFICLCREVLPACGLKTVGLEKMVERTLKRQKRRKAGSMRAR